MLQYPDAKRVRTLFVSDVHLGTTACQAKLLLDFLRSHEADTIYLVGDIVDGWRLRPRRLWPRSHLDVISDLLAKARRGTRIVYIPGNHDESLRKFVGLTIGDIEVAKSAIHETADGRRYLVLHGDQFDLVVQRIRWLALVGDWAYRTALAISSHINLVQQRFGLPYSSFSARANFMVKSIVSAVSRSEELLADEAGRHGVHGVVWGHTHHPVDYHLAGVHYLNTGDWVESCTGVVEQRDGRLEIVRWADIVRVQSTGREIVRPDGACPAEANDIPAEA